MSEPSVFWKRARLLAGLTLADGAATLGLTGMANWWIVHIADREARQTPVILSGAEAETRAQRSRRIPWVPLARTAVRGQRDPSTPFRPVFARAALRSG